MSQLYKKGKVKANIDISLQVQEGEILGVLGPNGAGKSTLIKQMIGHLKPTSGCVRYEGIQRRRYVRADAVLDVSVKMEAKKTAFQTVSSNISAGGIAVVMPEHISAEPGEKLYVSFSLPGKENEADITAEALTQRIFYDEKADKQKMTLEFTEIGPAAQQLLLQYCMRAQLQQRRNSLSE
ncbi:ATP-binding cassette domain-containing protein [Bacillus paralicheniformis]|nr:ATP-binding cassette domain-containing protein [Bacillus paralicheniformis]